MLYVIPGNDRHDEQLDASLYLFSAWLLGIELQPVEDGEHLKSWTTWERGPGGASK